MLQSVNFPADSSPPRSLVDNFNLVLKMVEDSTLTEKCRTSVPWLLWSIWKNRNSTLYADSHISIATWISQALEQTEVWLSLNKNMRDASSLSVPRIVCGWQPPHMGSVKCNVNAFWRNKASMIGGACITRDYQGNVLFHARDAFTPSTNNLTETLRCIIWAMQSVHDLGYEILSQASIFDQLYCLCQILSHGHDTVISLARYQAFGLDSVQLSSSRNLLLQIPLQGTSRVV